MKKFIIPILACMSLIACQQEIYLLEGDCFTGSIENLTTKTSLSQENMIYWSAGDEVTIFEKSTVNKRYKVIVETAGSSDCILEYMQSSTNSMLEVLNHNVAVYPYSSGILCNSSGNDSYVLNMTLQTEQAYAYQSFTNGVFPMVAVSTGSNLSFKNVCGAIMIQAKGDLKVASVTITGNKNEKLSGSATLTANYGAAPAIVMDGSAHKEVVLDCGDGVQLSPQYATEFILTVPPTEFVEGFKVVVKDIDDKEYVFNATASNKVERSSILVMPEVTIEKDEEEVGGIIPFTTATLGHEGISYIWDDSVIPEITINMTKDEWNKLLKRYDEFEHNVDYFHADFTYKKGNEVTVIEDGGIRLRGNTSRRRPEGNSGQMHNSKNPDWHHCHFGINFRKFHKDSDHELKGIRKMNLKWFKDDPCYVRELYCYDLFRRYGIWTSAFSTYARVWLQIDEETPAYLGVYDMIEPVDDKFVSKRVNGMFEKKDGFLWKCVYGEGGPADLKTDSGNKVPAWKMNWDQDNGINYTYEFKGDEEDFEAAKIQLGDFMQKLTGKGEESFYKWIKEVCDVEFLLKTYAVNVAVGMWDDHWGNGNNYYLYFNTTDQYEYEVFFIPYDYDNTLGTSGIVNDAGRQNPYDWGNTGLLMERLMRFDEFKQMYKNALQELVDPANGLFHMDASVPRIKAWQQKISPYVSNHTGEDMSIYDAPASWGNCSFYRLMDTGSNNFFRVKTETINNMK